ncbi:MAG: hypothetical protein JWM82_3101 [Myxococcales bacterium]|nr:hypothetical protein [Myxococcales bacterium]
MALAGCFVRAEPGPPPRSAPPPVYVEQRPVIVGVPPGQVRREEVHERNAERHEVHQERKQLRRDERRDEHEHGKHGHDDHDHDRD